MDKLKQKDLYWEEYENKRMEDKMFCPVCKGQIEVIGKKRLETLTEHVSDPNGTPYMKNVWKCSNKYCVTHRVGICWSNDGELYQIGNYFDTKGIKFIDNNNAPFGSFSRQMNIETSKKDENFYIFKNLFGWKLKLKWKYKSNKNGDILSKKPSFVWITPDNTVYIGNIRMFNFILREYKRVKKYTEDVQELKKYFFSSDKRKWRVASIYFLRIFQYRYYKKIKEEIE